MRYAVVSDIHSNLEALKSVLREIEHLAVERIVCLGDVVGYNANPNECVRILVERQVPSLMGNHDAAACGLEDPVDFNPIARQAALWTRESLMPESSRFLAEQPEQLRLSATALLVHGSILHRDHYLMSRYDMMENIHRMRAVPEGPNLLFFGHTHYQVAICCEEKDDSLSVVSSSRFPIRENARYLINPGSVGQPRDHNPRSAFLVYDDAEHTVEFVRVSYDVQACAQKILSQGLPRELADRLYQGW